MLKNNKGAALMQVLLVTAVLAGMATMLLRASLSRMTSVRQTRLSVSQELLIESCQAEINMMWSQKKPAVFQRDMAGCWMNCKIDPEEDTWSPYTQSKCYKTDTNATRSYTCKVPVNGDTVSVTAEFTEPSAEEPNKPCELTYTVNAADTEQL